MKIPTFSKKTKRKLPGDARVLVQILFLILAPGAFTSAFAGVKAIFAQIGIGQPIEMNAFVRTLLALCLYTMAFGRFFCGFACPFGAAGDWLYALHSYICKKRKKKPGKHLHWAFGFVKYVVLAVLLLLNFLGAYGVTRGMSPWDVFSMLTTLKLRLDGYVIGVFVLITIAVLMFFEERFFCRVLCPMGAVFSLLPVLPFFTPHRTRESCLKNCSHCESVCPSGISIPDDRELRVCGDCFQCQKCSAGCPKANVHTGMSRRLRGSELWLIALRALLLLGILWVID